MTYRDLATLAEVPPPHRIHDLTLALEDLIREDHRAGRPLLAALAKSVSALEPGEVATQLQGRGHGSGGLLHLK